MLKGSPGRWPSWNYSVEDESGGHAGDVELAPIRERGVIRLSGTEHEVYRESGGRGVFLVKGGSESLKAIKPSAFSGRLEIQSRSGHYVLDRKSPLRRERLLYQEGRVVGSIAFEGFSRRVKIDLPDELPLELRMFVFWLTLMIWKREDAAGG